MIPQSNRSAQARAAGRSFSTSSRFRSSQSNFSTHSSAFRSLDIRTLQAGSTYSGTPPTRLIMTGVPQAMLSRITLFAALSSIGIASRSAWRYSSSIASSSIRGSRFTPEIPA